MKRIHIVGRKNHGKTTLICELVGELTRRGFRVGTIKHTHHDHELDTPGKDSHSHRLAGSVAIGILTQGMNAIFWPNKEVNAAGKIKQHDRYEQFDAMMRECDIVLVEGDSQSSAKRIEVFRKDLGTGLLAASDPDIAAVVTDDELYDEWEKDGGDRAESPTWKRSDVGLIAQNILLLLELT